KPIFWGHIARNHCSASSKNGFKYGGWIYDDDVPIPEGSMIFRNTHEPVWNGELGERVKAEIRRRSDTVRGNTDPEKTHRFSGLGICAECGSFWTTQVKKDKNYRGVLCPASKSRATKLPDCSN